MQRPPAVRRDPIFCGLEPRLWQFTMWTRFGQPRIAPTPPVGRLFRGEEAVGTACRARQLRADPCQPWRAYFAPYHL